MDADSRPSAVCACAVSKRVIGPSGELLILNDINLEVAAGQSIAILGTSGSGKSTLLGLLAGLDAPTSGEIYLEGQCLTSLGEEGRARLRAGRIGFVFQTFQLIANLSAVENVMLPLELMGRPATEPAVEALTRVGLEHRLHHRPHQLSGGEQQRVAIARAFVSRPAVLFADEPTGNLDESSGTQITDLLFSLNAVHDAALILVTHDSSLASRCERSLRLSGGCLHE